MNHTEMMEDQFPGCSNGRRLRLMREAKHTLRRKLLIEYCARSHVTLRLVQQQLVEMDANHEAMGFAVTDHELSMAVQQGTIEIGTRRLKNRSEWKVLGF